MRPLIVQWGTCYLDDVIKFRHFPRFRPFGLGIHRSPVNSPHKGQWRGALMFSLICAWINSWVNNGEAGDLSCHHTHYDVTVMKTIVVVHDCESFGESWLGLNSLSCGRCGCGLKCVKLKHNFGINILSIQETLRWNQCQRTLLMISQHWLR